MTYIVIHTCTYSCNLYLHLHLLSASTAAACLPTDTLAPAKAASYTGT